MGRSAFTMVDELFYLNDRHGGHYLISLKLNILKDRHGGHYLISQKNRENKIQI